MHLAAETRDAVDAANSFGIDLDARDEFDPLDRGDLPAPPGPWVRLSFANHEWTERPGHYSRDVRRDGSQAQTWQLEITSQNPGEPVTLRASAKAGLPPSLTLRLFDLEQDVAVDLRQGDALAEYKLFSFGASRPYRLAIVAGAFEDVDREAEALTRIPPAVVLGQNSPNPFSSPTRIKFGVPTSTKVSLNIYSVRGELVASVLNGQTMPAGYHVVFWDGTDSRRRQAANGIYFCRLETALGSFQTRKMTLMR
jgi:hypothetical protein